MIKECQKINLQEPQCNRNATANFVNLIMTSGVHSFCKKSPSSFISNTRFLNKKQACHLKDKISPNQEKSKSISHLYVFNKNWLIVRQTLSSQIICFHTYEYVHALTISLYKQDIYVYIFFRVSSVNIYIIKLVHIISNIII